MIEGGESSRDGLVDDFGNNVSIWISWPLVTDEFVADSYSRSAMFHKTSQMT